MRFDYGVIVVGAGHAGCEAAVASARLGVPTLLITSDLNSIAQMSCNPAVGGIAKGQIVREIDALGGMTGIVADETAIQFRMLNRSKGPAVWSPRVQSDRRKFSDKWRHILENAPNLYLFQDMVTEMVIDNISEEDSADISDNTGANTCSSGGGNFKYRIAGVRTRLGFEFKADKVILTAGTFLGGLMHFGATQIEGGRISEPASHGITEQLASIGFEVGRMKTGTPARVDAKSIDFSLCEEQGGDDLSDEARDFHKFSFLPDVKRKLKSRSCFITHTSPDVHAVLKDNLADSPLYNGQIKSIGPRYCPSIETKITTFADKESHQLFLEPEGEETQEFYINGFSSSLPWRVQLEALQQIPALRDVHFYRPGYAIEYDYFLPTQLTHDLQTKTVEGLYFAGQVNGTTGYEEAASQGLMAGINAARAVRGDEPVVLGRDEAYIGVLIDDLVTKGVDEPYRMFTSRAEYRILLRQDDADMRLTPLGHRIGLASDYRLEVMTRKRDARDKIISYLAKTKVSADENVNAFLKSLGSGTLDGGVRMIDLLRRPQISLKDLLGQFQKLKNLIYSIDSDIREEAAEAAEIFVKYEGYIHREREIADKARRLEDLKLPNNFDYISVKSLSTEARQKLSRIRPATIGAASRIPGVSPADVNILLMLSGR